MKKRLLIIDDEAGIRKGLEEALADTYDLLCAECAEDAWELIFFLGEHVDLIVTDIVLPGMDGLEFIKKMREINPWVPAIVITGNSDHGRAIKAANLHVGGYIQKPFNIELLRSKIEDLFKNYECGSPFNVSPQLILKKAPSTLHPITIKTLREIHRNYHTHLTGTDMAASLGVCVRHMSRVFKDDCGMSQGSYILKLRIEVARQLLEKTKHPVAKVMEFTGFKNNSYFFACFKRNIGMTPEVFRRRDKSSI